MSVRQKTLSRTTIGFSNSTSQYLPKGTETRKLNTYMYNHVHSRISHNNQKAEATQVTINGLNKMLSIHTMEHYLALNRNEIDTCSNISKP